MPLLPSGGARWVDQNGTGAPTLTLIYFVRDPVTGVTSLSISPRGEFARIADPDLDGTFGLYELADITPSTPTRRLALLNGGAGSILF